MGSKVKLRKSITCKDPARKTVWTIKVNNPIDLEQFVIIDLIIHSLQNIPDNYLIIDVLPDLLPCGPITYIQTIRIAESAWDVEIHFERPCFFSYIFNGKAKIHRHPWTQYHIQCYSAEAVSAIFKQILCFNSVPDLSKWRDNTKELYLESLKIKS